MGDNRHALFEVSVKALIFDGGKLLVLRTPDDYVDFPGGRVDQSELNLSWPEALQREINEELGGAVGVKIGQVAFVSHRKYTVRGNHHVVAIFLRCVYLDGEIRLSDEHGGFEWILPTDLMSLKAKFMSDDEKAQLQTYFDTV